ncbi:hypothetical protein DNH61_16555 [Paenibacillus sambharensis]|uniref:DUF6792 domain-containing protein n=1 Tax=Paenibacillus sambharensis TaxID=1803190 RepID=A0A2W1L3H3_9BACL|nr:DUF6792 domain-containing protein [Paenibacillus sambharensis]PZD94578.1 hypothetical protein DNH61_16555 [Paenibacillus sambharensis]
MSIQLQDLTDEEKYFLAEFSYVDLQHSVPYSQGNSHSIREALDRALMSNNDPAQTERIQSLQVQYTKLTEKFDGRLEDVRIVGYQNTNPIGNATESSKTGFVGYALQDADGNQGYLFRGSEPNHLVDWTDNAASSFTGNSTQLKQANAFFEEHSAGRSGSISMIGHSKGNNLMTSVYLNNLDKDVYAYGINGQPIYWYDLTNEQKAALRGDRYTFIIHEYDFVNALGYVDYVDKVIELKDPSKFVDPKNFKADPFHPHSPGSVAFDKNGDFASEKPHNRLGRQAINNGMTVVHWGELLTVERIRTLFSDPLGLEIAAQISREAFYLLVDTVKVIVSYAAEQLYAAANFVKDQTVAFIARVEKLARGIHEKLKNWFDDATAVVKGVLKTISDLLSGAGGSPAIEPCLSVNPARLTYYAGRLSSIRNQIADINDRIDGLYRRVSIFSWGHLLRADLLTTSSRSLQQNIDYLNNSAQLVNRTELQINGKAQTF